MATSPGRVPLAQGGEDTNYAEHATGNVYHRRTRPQGTAGGACHIGEAAHHLGDLIKGHTIFIGARQKALQGTVDDLGVAGGDAVVIKAEFVQGAGAEVFHQDVRFGDEPVGYLQTLRTFQVDADGALVAVVHREITGAGALKLPGFITAEGFNLGDLRAQVCQYQSHGGPHDHVGELNHPETRKRLPVTRCVGRGLHRTAPGNLLLCYVNKAI